MMKNLRWFLPGFLAGLVIAFAPSCGPSSARCSPSNCAGCCTADGRCDPGNLLTACGISGNLCAACGPTDLCQAGFCTPVGGVKKDGGPDNNKDGGPQNPDGGTDCAATECRANNGACIPLAQQTKQQCGNLGQACAACPGTLTCDTTLGACRDTTCNGCMSNGACVTGTSNTACGAGGLQCAPCGSGEMCQNGACVPTSGNCGPGNCSGCCQNGTCVGGNSASACGTGGNACTPCGSGQTCSNGTCGSSNTVKVGSACQTNSDCSALGAQAICKLYTSSYNASYSGGYCTFPCSAQGACGTGAECFNLASFGEGDIQCYDLCSPSDPCTRSGYSCVPTDGNGNGLCWIDPLPTPPTAPAGTIGSTCTTNANCQASGSFPSGACQPSVYQGSSTGWTGGYCSSDCTFSAATCGSGGTCIAYNDGQGGYGGFCLKSCSGTGQSTCRTGYVCMPAAVFVNPSTQPTSSGNVCYPNCNNPGQSCPSGKTCQSTGYCQ